MKNRVYQEKKINDLTVLLTNHISTIQHYSEGFGYGEPGEDEYIDQQIETYKFRFNSSFKNLFILVSAYLDSIDAKEILSLFKKDLSHIMTEDFNGIQTHDDDDDDEAITYYFSKELQSLKQYLSVFEAFDTNLHNSTGLIYLENILNNTATIILDLKKKPASEVAVYNCVKFVVKAVFPNSIHPSQPFYQTAKCYKPDILIPSLNTAIEYKFANKESRLIKTIEEIHVDVRGYANHPDYKIFYAVFYVKSGICSEARFNIIWKEQAFPDNWRPIIVFGL